MGTADNDAYSTEPCAYTAAQAKHRARLKRMTLRYFIDPLIIFLAIIFVFVMMVNCKPATKPMCKMTWPQIARLIITNQQRVSIIESFYEPYARNSGSYANYNTNGHDQRPII